VFEYDDFVTKKPQAHGALPGGVVPQILVYLERFPERPDADRHREKASEEVPQFSGAKSA
jgi:hypothetical protein